MIKRCSILFLITVVLLSVCIGCTPEPAESSGDDGSAPVVTTTTEATAETTTSASVTDAEVTTGTQTAETDTSHAGTADGGEQTTTPQSSDAIIKPTTNKSTALSSTQPTVTTTTKRRVTGGVVNNSGSSATLPTGNTGSSSTDKGDHPGEGWELFWADEFNGDSLDTSKWQIEVGGSNGTSIDREENVSVENGQLVLTARREYYKGHNYTTSGVNTSHKFSFQYGRLEFRARLPYGSGVFPALWTLGDSYLTTSDELGWPVCGEIDVMEFIGGGSESEKYTHAANAITTCNLHWGPNRDEHQSMGTTNNRLTSGIAADEYHIYAIEWDEEKITWFFDDKVIAELGINDPSMGQAFHQKHWIIMNTAFADFEPDMVDDTTPLPQSMYVDYVRVYKKTT